MNNPTTDDRLLLVLSNIKSKAILFCSKYLFLLETDELAF